VKLEEQIVSLELAKELKENGYPQEGLWWWDLVREKEDCDVGDTPEDEWIISYKECYQGDKDDLIVAPTVAELGESFDFTFHQYKAKNNKYVCLCGDTREEATTEADARAKMWLYLKKEGVI